jgi:hypothetical protein
VGITVDTADGRSWIVRRRIVWPRWRELDVGVSPLDALDVAGFGDSPAVYIVGAVVVVAIALVIVLLLPLILFVAEALVALVAIALLRGTWLVEASTSGPPPEIKAWKIKGWSQSRRAVDEVASEIRVGAEAAPTEGEAAPV